jgi:ribonuclease HI
MIYGGHVANASARHRKQERREVCSVKVAAPVYLDWSDKPITFDQDDHPDHVPSPGKYPLVVDPVIGDVRLTKVLMDGGSCLNIIYAETLRLLRVDLSSVRAGAAPFHGIVPGKRVQPLGQIDLPVCFGTPSNFRRETLTFEVVGFRGTYHAVLGRPCYAKFMAIPNYTYLKCETLSFLDAYSGYHQIKMKESDQLATSFITPFGMYCYVTMSFGLRNAGATYQRCMNHVFGEHIGRTVEAYVDDIVVKTRKASDLLSDLELTFRCLKAKGVKLNPEKCVFGVPRGMLLGFIVSERGIEANPEKIAAITGEAISFAPRKAIKSQVLADFIAEWVDAQLPTAPIQPELWTMFFDGSLMKTGAGAGLLFVSPLGKHLRYVLRLHFPASNNVAEYEALINGLRIAIELGVRRLDARGDSQLVIDQVMKNSLCRDPKMEAYCEEVRRLEDKFYGSELNHIARRYNETADELVKIASGRTTVPPDVFSRDLHQPSVKIDDASEPEVPSARPEPSSAQPKEPGIRLPENEGL